MDSRIFVTVPRFISRKGRVNFLSTKYFFWGSLIILFLVSGAAADSKGKLQTRVKAAVEHARKGEFDSSLEIFDRLAKKFPGNPDILADYVVVLGWAGDCKKGTLLFEKNFWGKKNQPAVYVLKQVAKCYRDLKKFRKSIEAYKKALSVRSGDLDVLTGLAYVYSESGKIDDALGILNRQIEKNPGNRTLKLALAYVYERDGDYLQAVLTYDGLLKIKKEKRVLHARLRALSRLGAHSRAIKAAADEGVTDKTLLNYLKGNFAARLISWQRSIPPNAKGDKWEDLNRAIKILTGQLEADRNNERALFDLMGARVLLGHPKGLLRTFERFKLENRQPPDWVKDIAADAYMETGRAEPAIIIYKTLLESDPGNYNRLKKLYSAYILKNDLTKAGEVLNGLLSKESSPTVLFDGIVAPNWKKVELETDAAWLAAYKDRLYESQKRFEYLLSKAPHNSSIHSGVAHVLLWRGLPESAEKEFQWILNYDPTYTSVRTGYAETLMELMKFREAEAEVEKLSSVYPVTRQIEKINNRWKALTRPGVYSQGTLVNEERGGKDWGADFNLYSRLFRYRYRFDFSYARRQSIADGVTEDYSRAGIGIIYNRRRLLNLAHRFEYDPQQGGDFGTVTSVEFVPNDYVSVSASYKSFLFDIPLRARIGGIDGKSFDMSLRLSSDERTAVSVNASISRYTDTNRRKNFSLLLRHKIIPGFRYRAFVELNGYIGTNSIKNTVYFNPEREVAYTVIAMNEFTMVNIFGKRFIQNLNVAAGQYFQKGFSSGITADIRYEQRWDISAGRELVYGINWKRSIYDGNSEQTPGVYANFRYRF